MNSKTKVELLGEIQSMSDKEEIVELCKIALHLGGPQNLSAVGIGRYLRLVNPDFVIALISQLDQQRFLISSIRKDKSEPCDGCFMADAEALRTDAGRFQFIAQDAESSLEKIYGDDWLSVVDQLIGE